MRHATARSFGRAVFFNDSARAHFVAADHGTIRRCFLRDARVKLAST